MPPTNPTEFTDEERKGLRHPRLVKGLIMAARNLWTYGVDRAYYPFNPDQNADKPTKRPNYVLREYIESLKEV